MGNFEDLKREWLPIPEDFNSDRLPLVFLIKNARGQVSIARRDPQVKAHFPDWPHFEGAATQYMLID